MLFLLRVTSLLRYRQINLFYLILGLLWAAVIFYNKCAMSLLFINRHLGINALLRFSGAQSIPLHDPLPLHFY